MRYNFKIVDGDDSSVISVDSQFDVEFAWKDAASQYATKNDLRVVGFSADCSRSYRSASVSTGFCCRNLQVHQVGASHA